MTELQKNIIIKCETLHKGMNTIYKNNYKQEEFFFAVIQVFIKTYIWSVYCDKCLIKLAV